MINQSTEIAIVGGGMVSGALVLGLAQYGFAITVTEHAQPASFVTDSQPDVRISAISAAPVPLLKGVEAWDAAQVMRCHPYHRLGTWEWEMAYVVSNVAELKLPLLGYMVESTVLQQALWQTLEAHPKVTLRVSGSLVILHRHNGLQELELKGGETILAKLVTGVDDANSQVRQMAGIGVHVWQHAQLCMLISVRRGNDLGDSTWQQFTPDRPRAFLPLFDNRALLVRYDSLARIRQLQNINMAQLQAEIVKYFPSRLGYAIPSAAGAFPLVCRHALQHVQSGPVLVDDAAHTIHPLVGQGVNLGYRDTDAPIDALMNARSYGEAWASYPVLKRYQMRCMADSFMMQNGMDLFHVGFSNNLPPLCFVRNPGLMAAECAGMLKRQVLKYVPGLQPHNIVGCMPTADRIRRGDVAPDFEG